MGKIIKFKKPIPEHKLETISYSVKGQDEILDIECSTLTIVTVMGMCLRALQETEMNREETDLIRKELKRLELLVHSVTLGISWGAH